MKSVRMIIGLPVLVSSRVVGHVTDVDVDLSKRRVTGVFIGAMPLGMRLIGWDDIEIIGDVSVIARHGGHICKPRGRRLVTAILADGRRVGLITGALVDEATGFVEAVELSQGLWEDIFHGRRWVFDFARAGSAPGVFINPEGGNEK